MYYLFRETRHFFFFNDTATTEIYTLSLHDALPIWEHCRAHVPVKGSTTEGVTGTAAVTTMARRRTVQEDAESKSGWHNAAGDRKSTRLNSSHANISYAVFCLKKKKR